MTATLPSREEGVGAEEIRVLVVDDHRTFADLLSMALSRQPDLRCIGAASGAAEAVAMVADLHPDLVVMDIEMPRQDGLTATRRIREISPTTAVVVVTAHRDPQWVVRAAQAGASGFAPKDGSFEDLLEMLREVRPGKMVVAATAFAGRGTEPQGAGSTPALTPREFEVLVHLGRGLAPRAISDLLGISVNTCRGYVKAVSMKLCARSQLEAVVRAQELGLLAARRP